MHYLKMRALLWKSLLSTRHVCSRMEWEPLAIEEHLATCKYFCCTVNGVLQTKGAAAVMPTMNRVLLTAESLP